MDRCSPTWEGHCINQKSPLRQSLPRRRRGSTSMTPRGGPFPTMSTPLSQVSLKPAGMICLCLSARWWNSAMPCPRRTAVLWPPALHSAVHLPREALRSCYCSIPIRLSAARLLKRLLRSPPRYRRRRFGAAQLAAREGASRSRRHRSQGARGRRRLRAMGGGQYRNDSRYCHRWCRNSGILAGVAGRPKKTDLVDPDQGRRRRCLEWRAGITSSHRGRTRRLRHGRSDACRIPVLSRPCLVAPTGAQRGTRGSSAARPSPGCRDARRRRLATRAHGPRRNASPTDYRDPRGDAWRHGGRNCVAKKRRASRPKGRRAVLVRDGPDIAQAIAGARAPNRAKVATYLLQSVIARHRDKWADLLLRTALWMREAPLELNLCWRELAIVAKALADGRDMAEIGLMRDIAQRTLAVLANDRRR